MEVFTTVCFMVCKILNLYLIKREIALKKLKLVVNFQLLSSGIRQISLN